MEPAATALLVIGGCVAAGLVTLRAASFGTQVMIQMFRSPADLGWPTGVQEDDDFHWQWSSRPAVPGGSEVAPLPYDPGPRPELVELPGGTGPRPRPVARN